MSEEIKIGEYFRTKKGKIHKWSKGRTYIGKDEIVKHSKNIAELLEIGDYVNERRVFATKNRIDGEKVILVENYSEWTDDAVVLNKDIRSIVTKELYKEMEYRI